MLAASMGFGSFSLIRALSMVFLLVFGDMFVYFLVWGVVGVFSEQKSLALFSLEAAVLISFPVHLK